MKAMDDLLTRAWRACLSNQTAPPLALEVEEVVEACRCRWPDGPVSYLLPFLLPRYPDLVFSVIEELTLEYEWPTGTGYAKLVLPQVLFRAPTEGTAFLKSLFELGNRRQRKAVAEALRALVYYEPEWTIEALHRCLQSEHETIRKEAARALPCVAEVNVFAAEQLRQFILHDAQIASLLNSYDLPDQETLLRLVQRQTRIDVGSFLSWPEPPMGLLLMLALGLPGFLLADPAAGAHRLEQLSAIEHAQVRFGVAAHAGLLVGIDPRLVDRMLTRTIHESDWEIRRLAAIPLALLAADGDAKARSRLSELGSDPVLPVAKFHSAALAALDRSGSVP